jgi:signal transduction histidine kinase
VDLGALVQRSVRELRQSAEPKGIDLTVFLPGEAAEVIGDRASLGLIVDNLVDNAIKYTPEGGRVVVRLFEKDGSLVFEVEDDGIGIDPVEQERIFERFYRVDKARSRELGGTGLGLAIVKHACTTMGAKLSVDSAPGRGSTFRVSFPGS